MRVVTARPVQPVERFFQFSVLGLLASGYFALVSSGSLDLPTIVITAAGLIARLFFISGVFRFRISGRWVAAATLAYIGFYPIDVLYLTREFIPATVHLICFLAVVRVLTATSNRDFFFVKTIAFLELVAATLLAPGIGFFVFLSLFVVFGVATFCCSEMRRSIQTSEQTVLPAASFHGRLAGLTSAVTVAIILMTGGLFLLLPRTARAAFRSLVSERYHLPGFSNEITLGQIGELNQQSTPVMHVRLDTPNETLPLKWRGAALSRFDGVRWYNKITSPETVRLKGGRTLLIPEETRPPGARVAYEVRIGPVDSDTLFFAGIPESVTIENLRSIFRGPGDTYRTGFGSAEGKRYMAISYLPDVSPAVDGDLARITAETYKENLLLPGNIDERVIALAQREARGSTLLERARSLEVYLRTTFTYTTELPKEVHEDPLAYFLFERRRGHCEYFASGLAVMLRAIHIPSRVITGFQSGTYNPITGWQVIRASDAHSWVEAWIPGRGWTTFDATPPDTSRSRVSFIWQKLMLYLDAADTFWRDWVVDYNLDQQIDLVARVERQSHILSTGARLNQELQAAAARTWTAIRNCITWAGLAFTAAVLGWFFYPRCWEWWSSRRHTTRISRGQAVASDAAVLYTRMLRILKKRGLEKPAWLTPMEFAHIVPDASESVLVRQITTAYHDLRYGGRAEAGPRMMELIQELENVK